MFSSIVESMSRKRQEELLRQAAYDRLLQMAQQETLSHKKPQRKFATWLGTQLVRWGYRLKGSGERPSLVSHQERLI